MEIIKCLVAVSLDVIYKGYKLPNNLNSSMHEEEFRRKGLEGIRTHLATPMRAAIVRI